jgi:branched-chain amino acid transport system permease protein
MLLNFASRYIRKAYTSFTTYIYDVPPRMLALLIIFLLAVIPYVGTDLLMLGDILIPANLMAILAVSWDLLVGRTGQISLGHAMFYGVGAYATALLFKYFNWPVWITIPLSLLAGTGIALIIGIPCLRMKGPYLALTTMAFPLAITGFLFYFRNIFGGETGIGDIREYVDGKLVFRKFPKIFPSLKFYDRLIADYYLSLALMVISAIIIYKIATSKTGIVLISILDDELGAKACGINVTKYKLMSFAISGLFGSLAGALCAHMLEGKANANFFHLSNSLTPVIVTILGGIGTIYGPLVGTYIYYILNKYIFLRVVPLDLTVQLLLFVIVVVIMILRWPRGLARAIVEKLEDLEEPREVEVILKEKAKSEEKS